MAKKYFIAIALIAIIAILLYIAVKPAPTITTPVPLLPTYEPPTQRAPEPIKGPPTQKAPEITPTQPGTPAELVYPQTVDFWVNEIRVPVTTNYEGGSYIPIKESNIKTFAGSIGPYYDDPTSQIRVILCSELYKAQAAPSCETVPIIYRNNYVSFARGYQFDEYIGGNAAKDYIAYYDVYVSNTKVATSNVAVIRTTKD